VLNGTLDDLFKHNKGHLSIISWRHSYRVFISLLKQIKHLKRRKKTRSSIISFLQTDKNYFIIKRLFCCLFLFKYSFEDLLWLLLPSLFLSCLIIHYLVCCHFASASFHLFITGVNRFVVNKKKKKKKKRRQDSFLLW
jgi:hypothetical protein